MEKCDSILQLQGIGPKIGSLFQKLNIETNEELLKHYPIRYETFEAPCTIDIGGKEELESVEVILVRFLTAKTVNRLPILKALFTDGTDDLVVTWFHMPYLRSTMKIGEPYILRGKITTQNGKFSMEHPTVYTKEKYNGLRDTYQPIYGLTKGLTSQGIRKVIKQVLEGITEYEEELPSAVVKEMNLLTFKEAIKQIHFPSTKENLLAGRKRLIFQEFFQYFYRVQSKKEERIHVENTHGIMRSHKTDELLQQLPYELTNAQKRVWEEIQQDLTGNYIMNRFVQGDVGSGKTILAYLALIMCAASGKQGALMVPTEVLANQHYEGLLELIEQYHVSVRPLLLTGSLTAKEKRLAYEQIQKNEVDIMIGTHALIQEKVQYDNLALVITDEQHRFGVKQRETLARKGEEPHVLVMSATPIPRSLAMVLYADMDLSIVDELPANRICIKNCVITPSKRKTSYDFMKKEVEKGNQVYVICPMVEPSEEESGLENVIEYTEKLSKILPSSYEISYLHGKMKSSKKEEIMNAYSAGKIQILVSTTVIEVGINVPNATVMMVENAQQFGLAQLHQLRGRVGRGKDQSYCIFVNTSKSELAKERLAILNESNDGFYIASKDLELRGSGDIGGIRQSGYLNFQIGDIYEDSELLKKALYYVNAVREGSIFISVEEEQILRHNLFDFLGI